MEEEVAIKKIIDYFAEKNVTISSDVWQDNNSINELRKILNGGMRLLNEAEYERAKEKIQGEIKTKFLYIKHIKIYNFKIFEQIEISQLSDTVNVIIGFNGAGKTTLLQAIVLGFLPKETNQNYFKTNFFNKKIVNNTNIPEFEKYSNFIFNKVYDKRFELFNNILISNDINRDCVCLAYGVNIFTKENFDHKTFSEKILNGKELPYFVDSLFTDYCNEFYNPLYILDNLLYISRVTDNVQLKNEYKQILEVLLKTLNIFLEIEGIEKYKIKLLEHKYSFVNSKGLWNLHEISEGYRANILLITDILMRILASRKTINNQNIEIKNIFNQVKGFIFIDEFDRHLHPIWQQKFLFKLKQILPKIQFFVTTHNVFALQSAVNENLIQLTNKAVANYVCEKIENKSILGIINNYFTNNLFDFETQKKFNNFSNILSQIYSENKPMDFIYTQEFKDIVKELYNSGNEIETIVTTQILKLNLQLKQLNNH